MKDKAHIGWFQNLPFSLVRHLRVKHEIIWEHRPKKLQASQRVLKWGDKLIASTWVESICMPRFETMDKGKNVSSKKKLTSLCFIGNLLLYIYIYSSLKIIIKWSVCSYYIYIHFVPLRLFIWTIHHTNANITFNGCNHYLA